MSHAPLTPRTVVLALTAVVLALLTVTASRAQDPNQDPNHNDTRPGAGAGFNLPHPVVHTVQRLPDGNTGIIVSYTVQFGEVLVVAPSGRIVWRYDKGMNWAHSAHFLITGNVVISDTNHNRCFEITREGQVVWEYGTDLLYPNDADRLPNGNTLITVRDRDRVVEVTPWGQVVWGYDGVKGPHNSDRLANGHTMIANSEQNRVIEVDDAGELVWESTCALAWPRDADRLPNGNTLIADSNNNRVVEIDKDSNIVWQYPNAPMVYDCDRLSNGNTLLSDNTMGAARVLEVDADGRTVWEFRLPERTDLMVTQGFAEREPTTLWDLRREHERLWRLASNSGVNLRGDFGDDKRELSRATKLGSVPREIEMLQLLRRRLIAAMSTSQPSAVLDAVVLDALGVPVPDAHVWIYGTAVRAVTDASGAASLPLRMPLDRVALCVRAAGQLDTCVPLQLGDLIGDGDGDGDGDGEARATVAVVLHGGDREATWRNQALEVRVATLTRVTPKPAMNPPGPSVRRRDAYPPEAQPYLDAGAGIDCASARVVETAQEILTDVPAPARNSAVAVARAVYEWLVQWIEVDDTETYPLDPTCRGTQSVAGAVSANVEAWTREPAEVLFGYRATPVEFERTAVALLRALDIPARVAFTAASPLTQWWCQPVGEAGGRWVNMEVYVGRQEYDFAGSLDARFPAYMQPSIITWASAADGLLPIDFTVEDEINLTWRLLPAETTLLPLGNAVERADGTLADPPGLAEAQLAIENLRERGQLARHEDRIVNAAMPMFPHVDVTTRGISVRLDTLREPKPLTVRLPLPMATAFRELVDTAVWISDRTWKVETATEAVKNDKTGETQTWLIVTLTPPE